MATTSRVLKVPANLPELVRTAFAKARAENELHYFPTQVAILTVGNIPFQLRFSPSLANKPKPPRGDSSDDNASKPVDPFANPPASLFIADVGPAHYLVLNKFAIVPEHFILATREFKQQTHVLERADLEATMACIQAFAGSKRNNDDDGEDGSGDGGGGLFAFFNSGEHSGASQPHRHIQLLPVSRMRDGLDTCKDGGGDGGGGRAWSVLADATRDETPFATFSERIAATTDLHAAYLRLYRQAARYAATGRMSASGVPADGGEALMSYNLAMTQTTLVVCPRRSEGGAVRDGKTGREVGRLALNGTVLAGTALVKTQAEWDALRESPEGLEHVLRKIGFPRRDEEEEEVKRCSM